MAQQTLCWLYTEMLQREAQEQRKRVDWPSILGKKLTAVVSSLRARGLSKAEVFDCITSEYPGLSDELRRRLVIGIRARMGEMRTAEQAR